MEKKEGMISFIKQLFANNQTEEESLEKIDNIDEETRKELEKSYKHIDAMMEKYGIENFEVNQKEKVPSVKKARLEKVQINQEKMAVIDREVEHEENGEERE